MAQDLRLDVFQGDTLLQRLSKKNSSGNVLLLLPVLTLGTLFLLARLGDELSQPNLIGLLCRDVKAYVSANERLCASAPSSEQMSLLRDLPLLLTILLLSFTPALMFRQWTGIELFLASMEDRQILAWPKGRAVVAQEVLTCNAYFRRVAKWSTAALGFSFLSVCIVCKALAVGRVYPVLGVTGHGTGVEYSSWWAGISSGGWAWVGYVGWGTLFVYSVVLQNLYGGRVVLLLWRTRNAISYAADVDNFDGRYGWSDVRKILLCTWTAIIIHGISMAMVAISLPGRPAIYLSPLLFQWLVTTPFYIGIPVYLIGRNISRWKATELARLLQVQAAGSTPHQISAAGAVADRVRRVRVNPYAGMAARTVYLLGFISSLTVVIQILRIIY